MTSLHCHQPLFIALNNAQYDDAGPSFRPHAAMRQAVTLELHIENIRKVPRKHHMWTAVNVAVPISRVETALCTIEDSSLVPWRRM